MPANLCPYFYIYMSSECIGSFLYYCFPISQGSCFVLNFNFSVVWQMSKLTLILFNFSEKRWIYVFIPCKMFWPLECCREISCGFWPKIPGGIAIPNLVVLLLLGPLLPPPANKAVLCMMRDATQLPSLAQPTDGQPWTFEWGYFELFKCQETCS